MNAHRRQAKLARTLLSRREVLEFSRKRPAVVYADMLLIYLWLTCAFAVLQALPVWPVQVAAFLIIGTRQYALFIIGHDGLHRNLHPNRRINDRLATWLIFAPLGMCLRDGRSSHLRHHHQLGSERDPDRYLHGAENKANTVQFVLFLSGLATFLKTVWKVTPFGQRRSGSDARPAPTLLKEFMMSRIPVLVMQVLIFGAIAATQPWWTYLVFWVLPVFALVFVPDEIRAFCDHAHPIVPDALADDRRLITYAPPRLEQVLFSPHHMNYHAEHHLWPFVPYYRLPEVHRRIRPRLGQAIEVRRSYVGFLWHYLRSLPLVSGRPAAAARPTRQPEAVT